jgi:hypothetical protein
MNNNKMNLYSASLVICAVAALTATAAEETNNAAEPPPRPIYRPWTVGAEAGTEGIFGLFGSWRFSDHVGLRLGADYTQDSMSGFGIHDIKYDAKIRLLNEPLTLDVYPWQKHSFHVSFGWLFNQNQLTGTASGSGTITIDGMPFSRDNVGSLNVKIQQQAVAPYLSLGGNFFYFDHAHHWALGGELGVAYTGDPKVNLTRSGGVGGTLGSAIDAAVSVEQSRVQNYADQYKWWPVAKIFVSFSF